MPPFANARDVGVDLDAVLRPIAAQMQKEYGPKLEFVLREGIVRKLHIYKDEQGRLRVEDKGDANALFDLSDAAQSDFVEFEAARLTYIDRFEKALQAAFASAPPKA
ncbi:MAG TPA: hypothetical protein VM681_00335 [Candidatus Thermoplasmatota archaeon]|nr:hypothetical protein [Candidatus Thermoplasmatota archaeon]